MSKYKCNSCEAVYSDRNPDGVPYYHECDREAIEHATFDDAGKLLTPEKRTPRENIRNENLRMDLIERDGKLYLQTGSTQDEAGPKLVEVPSRLISEGKGRTLVE